jgi:hypothetical protein
MNRGGDVREAYDEEETSTESERSDSSKRNFGSMDPHNKTGGLAIFRQNGPASIEIRYDEVKRACKRSAGPEMLGSERKGRKRQKEVLVGYFVLRRHREHLETSTCAWIRCEAGGKQAKGVVDIC